MLKLRKALLLKFPYYVLLVVSILYVCWYLYQPHVSLYQGGEDEFTGRVENITINGAQVKLLITAKEKLLVFYYCQTEEELHQLQQQLSLGDIIKIKGELRYPTSTKNFYSFSYRDYLKYQHIYFTVTADQITKVKDNQHPLYSMKEAVRNHIASFGKAAKYINVFFIGDTAEVELDIKQSFQKLGISHLFALSGTQISFITLILQKFFKRFSWSKWSKFVLLHGILLFYYLIIEPCAAIDRALIFAFVFGLNRTFDFFISPFHLIIVSISILLFINPYYIFDIGFQYSTVIAVGLLLCMPKFNHKNKIINILIISIISFLWSLPISLYHFSWINWLSIFYNLLYVPFINVIIFPLSILTFFLPFLSPVLLLCVSILEKSVQFLNAIPWGMIILKRLPLFFYGSYFLVLIGLFFTKYTKQFIFLLLVCLILHRFLPTVASRDQFYILDVGQGDSLLMIINQKVVLIDTGGKMTYQQEAWQQQQVRFNGSTTIIQFIYHLGFSHIDYLILTHGDSDHMGESINLVNNFKVNTVIFNRGEYNDLELELIQILEEKNIPYYQKVKEIKVGHLTLYFLNDKLYDNENDNSNVIYTDFNGIQLLLMGDAGVEVEKDLLKKYDLTNVDIVKVGHHGSKTSTCKEFVEEIHPKYAIISVGENNRFAHPNKTVLETLKNSIIYRTDTDGSIKFEMNGNKLIVETYVSRGEAE